MYAEISAAIQSVKTIGEIAKAAGSLANYNELIAAVSDVNAKSMEATAVALASQERQANLLSRIAELERELSSLRARQSEKDKYVLHKFATGALAYQLRVEHESSEPPHYVCARCVDEGGHTKLQPWGARRYKCTKCETVLQVEPDPPQQPPQRRATGWQSY